MQGEHRAQVSHSRLHVYDREPCDRKSVDLCDPCHEESHLGSAVERVLTRPWIRHSRSVSAQRHGNGFSNSPINYTTRHVPPAESVWHKESTSFCSADTSPLYVCLSYSLRPEVWSKPLLATQGQFTCHCALKCFWMIIKKSIQICAAFSVYTIAEQVSLTVNMFILYLQYLPEY